MRSLAVIYFNFVLLRLFSNQSSFVMLEEYSVIVS